MSNILVYLKGVVIGIANVIPGVSGGTMAVILGIYERLTSAIGRFFTDRVNRRKNLLFLLVLGAGVVTAIVVFARLFRILLDGDATRRATMAFFGGLILGSVPFLVRAHRPLDPRPGRLLLAVLGAAVVVVFSLVGGASRGAIPPVDPLWSIQGLVVVGPIPVVYALRLAVLGFFATAAMILPGFSGSAFLVSMGEYHNILYFVDERLALPLAAFAAGAIPGLVAASRLLNWLLRRRPAATYYFIIGLVLGSFYQVALGVVVDSGPLVATVGAAFAGFVLAWLTSLVPGETGR